MPPNAKGGKGYKKKKKGGDEQQQSVMIDRQEGQMVARAIRLLGNRNVLCYCEDNRLRICHICGKMKGRDWVEPGDVVLVSVREFENYDAKVDKEDMRRGDIIAKYANDLLPKLRKEAGMNQKLFMKLEGREGITLEEVGVDKSKDRRIDEEEDDCGFEFEQETPADAEEGIGEEKKEEEEVKLSRAHTQALKKTNTANVIVTSAKDALKDAVDAEDDDWIDDI
jgi:translation initiation factor 1A